jgi:hypothetical protein
MFRLVIHRLPDRLILRTKTDSKRVFNGIFLAIFTRFMASEYRRTFTVLCSITHAKNTRFVRS